MKKLWSGLGGGIKNATGLLKDIATDFAEEPKPEKQDDKEIEHLKKHIESLKKEIKDKAQQIQYLQETLESCKKPVEIYEHKETTDLINFKIIIGMEDSARALELLEDTKAKLVSEKLKCANLQGFINSVESSNTLLAKSLDEKSVFIKELSEKLKKSEEFLEDSRDQTSSLQENLLYYKRQTQGNVESLYKQFKETSILLGMPTPTVKLENLGLEDIQEFLYTQSSFIKESINKLAIAIKGKFDIRGTASLDSLKDAVITVLEESYKKLQEYKEIAMSSENLFQLSKRENMDLGKKLGDYSRALDDCKKMIIKKEEEILQLNNSLLFVEDFKQDKEKFYAWYLKSEEEKKILGDELEEVKKKFEEDKAKFEKTYKYVNDVDEQIEENKQKIKSLSQTLAEKDRYMAALVEEKLAISEKLYKSQQDFKSETTYLKNYYEEKIMEINESYANDKKVLADTLNSQLSETSAELSKAMIIAKDVNLAKSMISKHQQCIDRLQEVVKNQEIEITDKSTEIEKLTQELEVLTSKLSKTKKKLLNAKVQGEEKLMESLRKIEEYEKDKEGVEFRIKESEDMRRQAERLLEQVQGKIREEDNMIDRRLVTTFLVNYLDEENNDKMRYQMLKPMAEILGLSKEQRIKVGLDQEQGLLAQFTTFLTRG